MISVTNPAALGLTADTSYNLTVQVDDGNGGTDTETVTVTVKNVNQAPGVPTGTGSVNENTTGDGITAVVTLAYQDGDNQVIDYTFSSALAGSNGKISADGLFRQRVLRL